MIACRRLIVAVALLVCAVVALSRMRAQAQVPVTVPLVDKVLLERGCTNVGLTWPDGTPVQIVMTGIERPGLILGIWKLDPVAGVYRGFSPAPGAPNDLVTVNRLDAVFICSQDVNVLARPALTLGPGTPPPPWFGIPVNAVIPYAPLFPPVLVVQNVITVTPAATVTATSTATVTPAPVTPPAHFVGRARIDGELAADETRVIAVIAGVNCGETTVVGGIYELDVAAASTVTGCGTTGATIQFLVGAGLATQTATWASGVSAFLDLTAFTLVATPAPPTQPQAAARFAGVAFDINATSKHPPSGTIVYALIGNTLCGSATITDDLGNFSGLDVFSAAQRPGCGTPGATISFFVGAIGATVQPMGSELWSPGAFRFILLTVAGPTSVSTAAVGTATPRP